MPLDSGSALEARGGAILERLKNYMIIEEGHDIANLSENRSYSKDLRGLKNY